MEQTERATLIEKLRDKADAAVTENLNRQLNAQTFSDLMMKELKARQGDVIWKLLGLDNKWGKWEVDHCDGRESPITRYLTQATAGLVHEWVNEAVAEVLTDEKDKLLDLARKAVKSEVKNRLSQRIQREACSQVEALAADLATSIVTEAMQEVRASVAATSVAA